MAKKGDAQEALSLLFQQDGVPPKKNFDGSKEQTLGVFNISLQRLAVNQGRRNRNP